MVNNIIKTKRKKNKNTKVKNNKQNNKSRRNIHKRKTGINFKKSKKYRGGNGYNRKNIHFIFIDKHNYGNIDFLKRSNDETIIDVIKTLKHDIELELDNYSDGGVNLLCLIDESDNIIGFILGTVNATKYSYNCHISNVYINVNQRGKKYCNLMMEYYIKKIVGLYSSLKLSFSLDNTGGERSCRCYTNAFHNNGFIQQSPIIDCKNHIENDDVTMIFNSPPRYQTRSVTARTVGV
jgi:hypothetical protein